MLIEQVRNDMMKAKKDKNTWVSTILSTLLSEAEKIGKDDGIEKRLMLNSLKSLRNL